MLGWSRGVLGSSSQGLGAKFQWPNPSHFQSHKPLLPLAAQAIQLQDVPRVGKWIHVVSLVHCVAFGPGLGEGLEGRTGRKDWNKSMGACSPSIYGWVASCSHLTIPVALEWQLATSASGQRSEVSSSLASSVEGWGLAEALAWLQLENY